MLLLLIISWVIKVYQLSKSSNQTPQRVLRRGNNRGRKINLLTSHSLSLAFYVNSFLASAYKNVTHTLFLANDCLRYLQKNALKSISRNLYARNYTKHVTGRTSTWKLKNIETVCLLIAPLSRSSKHQHRHYSNSLSTSKGGYFLISGGYLDPEY